MCGPQLCLGRCILEHVELVDEYGEEALHEKKGAGKNEKHDNGDLHMGRASLWDVGDEVEEDEREEDSC